MQQINLYLVEFRPKKDVLNFQQFLLATAGVFFLYLAFGWYISSNTDLMRQQVKQESEMLAPLQSQKTELDKMLAARPDGDRLEQSLSAVLNDIDNKNLALRTLKDSDIDASTGFSELLAQLAKTKNRKIWFTDIVLKNDVLILKGQTVDPKLISTWIDESIHQKALSRQFSGISIAQNDADRRIYDFQLSNGVMIRHE